MSFKTEITNHFLHGHKKYLPSLSVDCIIFGFHQNELKVLLLHAKYAGLWALPGGFIKKDEHADAAAERILYERTQLKNIYLQQFHVFSEPSRSTKKIYQAFLKTIDVSITNSWMFDRFITIGYTALVDFSKVIPVADSLSAACQWHNIHTLPPLLLDHKQIIEKALLNLRTNLNYHPIGYNLLPKKFTMPELQKLYETILDKKLDRRNFQRKITGTNILKKLPEIKKGVAHKAPNYYSFDIKNYTKALTTGVGFEL
jgi:ADP-ribose pyrophosphatase YjhB (NUDIX family)